MVRVFSQRWLYIRSLKKRGPFFYKNVRATWSYLNDYIFEWIAGIVPRTERLTFAFFTKWRFASTQGSYWCSISLHLAYLSKATLCNLSCFWTFGSSSKIFPSWSLGFVCVVKYLDRQLSLNSVKVIFLCNVSCFSSISNPPAPKDRISLRARLWWVNFKD